MKLNFTSYTNKSVYHNIYFLDLLKSDFTTDNNQIFKVPDQFQLSFVGFYLISSKMQ